MQRTTIRLPDELLRRARRKAAAERRTLTSLIEEGLRAVLAGRPQPKAARKLPRVSVAKGGLMPGVDLTSYSRLQEDGDLAYVLRMKHFR